MNIGTTLCLMLGGIFLLFGILFATLKDKGTILSHFLCSYSAIIAVVIWLILFIKDVHFDLEKAFDKYRL